MGNFSKRLLSFVLAILLLCGLLPLSGVEVQAATVNYVYNGQYLYNWGSRGTVATFMSPNAIEFYEDNNVTLDSLMSLSGSSSTGSVPSSSLYQTLKTLMTNNHSYKTSYDATKSLYKYTDCQNSGGKISSFYSGNEIGPEWGQGSWNREHTWPNSKGLGGQDENDIMMLRPTSTSENSSRGNTAYGKSSGYYDPNGESNGRYNLHGDVARIMLYTYVRWGNTGKMWGSSGVMENVNVLLEWMEEDPVDTWELGRNDAVEAITGTRNVFVDYPELVFVMFGSEVPANYTTPSGGSSSSVSYNITATANNNAWGTVSVAGRTVTATPATGYEVSGYELLSGTATVSRTGNQFILSPSTDVSIRINFAEKVPVPTVSQLQTGDRVVIYAPAYNKALTSETVATHYLAGADITEANGVITGYENNAVWTVTANTDGTYSFAYGSQKLGMADEYSSMKLGEAHDKWALVALGDGLYKVQNIVRGNYMEWYSSKDNWSTYTSANDSQFQLSFYVVGKGIYNGASSAPETPDEPDQPTTPETSTSLKNGAQVVIYAPAYNKALTAETAATHYLAGADITVSGNAVTGYENNAVWTVTANTDGTYSFANGGKLLGMADDYSSMKLGEAHNKWQLISLGGSLYQVKNTVRGNYMEWYASKDNWSTYSSAGDDQFQLSFYVIGEGILTETTQPAPEPPVEIEKLTAPTVKVSGQKLTWAAVENADSYEIYRATSKSGKYTLIGNTPSNYYEDISVAAKAYYYKVKAVYEADETKNSDLSKYVSLTRKCDTPVADIESDSSGRPVIFWDKIVGAKQYTIYRASSETGKYSKLGSSKTTSYTDKKASTGKTWYYKVVANGDSSKYSSGESNIVSFTVICAAPSVTVKVDAATGKPTLSWKKVDCAAGYRIFRQLPGGEYELIAEQKTTSFKDTTAPADTQCSYQVQTVGRAAELDSKLSKVITVSIVLAKPAVKGSADAEGNPVLTWNAVEGAATYKIYRSTKSNKGFAEIATVESATYTDTTVAVGKTYYYKVVAVGENTQSAESAYVKLSGKCATPELFVETAQNGKPYLKWYKVDGAKKYIVYRATSETGKYTKLGTTSKLEYVDTKASAGKTYYYKLVAQPSSGSYQSNYSNIVFEKTLLAAPSVKITTNTAGKPVLSWKKVSGATKYEIYLLGAEDYVTLATVTGTSWTDEGCAVGEGRYYGVRAIAAQAQYNSQVSEPAFSRATCAAPKLTGKLGVDGKPALSWEAVEGAEYYAVYRSTKSSSGYKVVGYTGEADWADMEATKGKTYYYKVTAMTEYTQSAMSNSVKLKSK